MPNELPLLPTSVIGSYAWPAWLHTALEAAQRGEYGPDDMREAQDDAVDLALRDQEHAGVDIVSDGEMRRAESIRWSLRMASVARLDATKSLPKRSGNC